MCLIFVCRSRFEAHEQENNAELWSRYGGCLSCAEPVRFAATLNRSFIIDCAWFTIGK